MMGNTFKLLDVRHTPIVAATEDLHVGSCGKFFGVARARCVTTGAAAGRARRPGVVAGVSAKPGVDVGVAAPPARGFDLPRQAGDIVIGAGPVVSRAAKRGAGRERCAGIADLGKAEANRAVSRAVERRVGVAAFAAVLLRDVGAAAGAARVVSAQRLTAESNPHVVQAA